MAAATDAMFVVRVAEESDIEALASLSSQLGYPVTLDEMRERYTHVRAARFGEIFVAATRDESRAVIGWAHVVPRLQLEEAPHTELAGLVVDQCARGSGVGAALLAAAEDCARAQGFATMRVRSNVVRKRAHRFYEREGYARVKAQTVFRKALG